MMRFALVFLCVLLASVLNLLRGDFSTEFWRTQRIEKRDSRKPTREHEAGSLGSFAPC